MKIQSLSVYVPNHKCINDCAFCCAKMHECGVPNYICGKDAFYDLRIKDYLKRLNYARDNGCNAVMLTGDTEPQQNEDFLKTFGFFMMLMDHPFRNIEMQTTGVLLDDRYLRLLRNHVGVNVISISMSSFDSDQNAEYIGMKPQLKVDLPQLLSEIKRYGFGLRLSLNLTDAFNQYTPAEIIQKCSDLGADQVTFRVLYSSGQETPQDNWIKEHNSSEKCRKSIVDYITGSSCDGSNGGFPPLRTLEYGATAYSVKGMSVVIDTDCMSKDTTRLDTMKYAILMPDCRLYSQWDDPASLIF